MPKVYIDDQLYIPVPTPTQDKSLDSALNLIIEDSEIGTVTIREYLRRLLIDLWRQEENFSSQRPFGSNGWQYPWQCPIFYLLIENGFIDGTLTKDENGGIEDSDFDVKEADKYMVSLIDRVFEKNG